MFDDLELRLRQQREELRRRQNERRQRQLESFLENSSSKEDTDTTKEKEKPTISSEVDPAQQSGAVASSLSIDRTRASIPSVASTPQKQSSAELSTTWKRWNQDLPSLPSREVGFLWKTSPSSSVSMSQSPHHQVVTKNNSYSLTTTSADPKESKSVKNLMDSENSEDDIDLVAIARAIEAAKAQKNKQVHETSFRPIDTAAQDDQFPAKSPAKQKLDPLSDDECDNKTSELRLQKNMQKTPSLEMKDDSPPTRPSQSQQQPPPRVVRNPLVAARREEAEVAILVLTRNGQKPTELAAATVAKKEDTALWSDSEPEDNVPETSPSSSRRNAKKRRQTEPNNSKKRNKISSASDESNKPQTQANISASTCTVEELQMELKPNFSHPKFGPFALQPLVLGSIDKEDHVYEVPASISRYLPDHQREGIQFLFHQAIAKRRGAILGDGT
jgi:hypothetical protein